MPPHLHYVEPFAGGLSVLLAKDPEGISEVVNDVDGELTNFWRVLADGPSFERFRRVVEAIPFSEYIWQSAERCLSRLEPPTCQIVRAVAFFVLCRQSLAGRMSTFSPITKTRVRRGMNNEVSAWLSAVEGLPQVHARLKRVLILNRDALEVIRQNDGSGTLFYVDPPYVSETRTAPKVYRFEYTREQHEALLAILKTCTGKVMLSGYPSALYEESLKGWTRHDFDVPNHAAGGKQKRRMTECVYCNF